MLYKNTFRLLFSNAHLIWKIMLYQIITMLAIFGLSFVIALPIVQVLVNESYFKIISDVYTNFLNTLDLKTLIVQIGELSIRFVDIINANFDKILFSLFGFGFVLIVLGSVVTKLHMMPTAVTLDYYMSSNVKHKFGSAFLESFKKNIAYQCLSLLIYLPLDFGLCYLTIYSFRLFQLGGAFIMFSPFLILFGFTILVALRYTLFCGWLPSIVVRNKSVFGGLISGFVVPKRRFLQTYGNAFTLVLTLVFLNVFGGVFTYGVGLIITLPVSVLANIIFGMVAFYSAMGQKYYLDAFNVMAPKTMEYTDKLSDQKYII